MCLLSVTIIYIIIYIVIYAYIYIHVDDAHFLHCKMVVRHRDTHWKIPVEQYVLQLFPLSAGNVNFPISVERNVFLIFLNRTFATAMLAFGSAYFAVENP